ncbi:MAG: DNA polymerase III subunit alpha [Candidatus Harrisonbacteria bacterium CG10_big_fil_rev_8_21_14_0_10_44_23]|uniref:DNA polymerase III subunit alpha n=1 Tax=Candidatus Harrisonbacteria bacterium CG10_big_fil_rev_8_21_14_0_10_44_23 TaxID=1974585 RepID=A0A2H0UPT3_9BACT|nr:MAG: DNA polymerase III subunit alpha [Candidatus Harrisonbacteria bacterium CG10_big_fil_rev_8_21_14_0_10_44_23]
MSKFVHLHTHTHYSLLDGMSKIPDLVKKAKELDMDALAITDHGNLYGAVEFYKSCKKAGIKPILGVEAYVAPGDHKDKGSNKNEDRYYHLVLLAKNQTGWENLIKLVTLSFMEGFYYKPRMSKDLLRQHSEGLIALSGCLGGELSQLLLNNKKERAKELAKEYEEIFGKGNYYIEIGNHPEIDEYQKVHPLLIEVAKETNIPLVATKDSHYLNSEDRPVHDILLAIQTGQTMDDQKRFYLQGYYNFESQEEMADKFSDTPEAIENTQKIAEMCNVELNLDQILLPKFDTPDGKTSAQYLRELVDQRTANRYPEVDEVIKKRIDYELSIIEQMGFPDYFLIVQDFINWAKDRGIVVGPGRGSAAGSIISYIVGITNIDPIKYDLLFERFLNPSRIQMPDIDVDITDIRRDEVFAYLQEKYGIDHVAHIITFGTMAARAAIRDVGRALNIEYSFCDQLAKLVPFGKDLSEALRTTAELHDLYTKDERATRIIDAAKTLEGVARHASVHACGTVIAAQPLTKYVPLQYSPQKDDVVITQFEMHAIEDLGLLKMDLLGLKNLTIIEQTIRLVRELYGEEVDIDKIPLDDKKVFALLKKADTTGVFQLESGGMRRYLKELEPSEFEDIIVMVAAYRPGPMELIPTYIARKHGREEVKYLHPRLEPIMSKTYGVGIYQEQMMRIASDLAGFSLTEADTLRKAIGKKIKELLDEQKVKLIEGMIKTGIDEATAKRIWELFPPFARYGFNRCLTGDTLIQDLKKGQRISIENLYKNPSRLKSTLSLNEKTLKSYKNRITDVIHNGKKEVFEITTKSGRKITATSNHPFFTPSGWQTLDKLKKDSHIATPSTAPLPEQPIKIEEHKVALTGYLLAEGNLCHPNGFYFYSKEENEIQDYRQALESFSNTLATINRSKSATSVYSRRENLNKPSEAVTWVNSIGMRGKIATEKHFPEFAFQLGEKDLALLIAKMFQGDGCITNKRGHAEIFYATSSLTLAQDLQHLLLRLKVLSTVHIKKFKYRKQIKTGYTVSINRYSNIHNLLNLISPHLIGKKQKIAQLILKEHPILNGSIKTWAARGSYDIIPFTVALPALRQAALVEAGNFKSASSTYGLAPRLFNADTRKIGFLRETIAYAAQVFKDTKLESLSKSDIYWDRIVSIKSKGSQPTYDLSMEKDHNFVANDVFVHNSHAAGYAMVAYQTAWLKAHYPVAFIAALLNADSGDTERIAFLIDEAKKMNIEVLPPDINKSSAVFTPDFKGEIHKEDGNIRFGLNAIKNVGHNIVNAIIEERSAKGQFKNFPDLISRITHKDLNKKSLESMTKAGVFDSFGINRNTILENMDEILKFSQQIKKSTVQNQAGLFGNTYAPSPTSLKLKEAPPLDPTQKLSWEKELLGLYVSDHPLKTCKEKIEKVQPTPIATMKKERSSARGYRIAGLVTRVKSIITKSNKAMAFAKLEDLTDSIELVIFPDLYEKTKEMWQEGKILAMVGKLSFRNGETSMIVDNVKEIV